MLSNTSEPNRCCSLEDFQAISMHGTIVNTVLNTLAPSNIEGLP